MPRRQFACNSCDSLKPRNLFCRADSHWQGRAPIHAAGKRASETSVAAEAAAVAGPAVASLVRGRWMRYAGSASWSVIFAVHFFRVSLATIR